MERFKTVRLSEHIFIGNFSGIVHWSLLRKVGSQSSAASLTQISMSMPQSEPKGAKNTEISMKHGGRPSILSPTQQKCLIAEIIESGGTFNANIDKVVEKCGFER